MWPLILFSDRSKFGMGKDAERDKTYEQAEADNPVEQGAVSSISRGVCGVFAQKNGSFASSQMAR